MCRKLVSTGPRKGLKVRADSVTTSFLLVGFERRAALILIVVNALSGVISLILPKDSKRKNAPVDGEGLVVRLISGAVSIFKLVFLVITQYISHTAYAD